MKNRKNLVLLSALILAGGITLGTVTSCSSEGTIIPFVVENEGDISLSLDDSFVVEAEDSKYFSPYVVDDDGELLSNGGDTLLTSGSQGHLFAYWVPEGYSLSAKVDGSSIKLSEDGTITAQDVTTKSEAVITLFAEAPTEDIELEDGSKVARVIKKSVNVTVIPQSQLASSGILKYATLSASERSEVTSQLERFAMKNGTTGVSLSDNGGYAVYNSRVHSPLLDEDSYLAGYGFGTFMYGSLSEGLAGESTEAYKYYYHEQITPANEPGSINYLDSDEAIVSDMYSYMSSSYYTTQLNEDYSQYEYIGALAREMPEPLDLAEDGTASKWKIKLWVGGDEDDASKGVKKDLCFRTSSTKYGSYDKRKITLSDYLTPFKLMANGAVGWYRGNEQSAESTANRQIKGFSDYYKASNKAKELPSDEEFSSKVGVSIDESDNSITIQFNAGFTEEYAIYQIDSLWSNPLCEDFIKEIGGGDVIKGAKLYGTSPSPLTPADTSLSVGPYYIESYSLKNLVTFKKNELWHIKEDTYGREVYKIEGYHIKCNSAIESDTTALFTAWEHDQIEAATLTDDKWEEYENDSRKKSVLGDITRKMTFNRMDKLLWDKTFGEGGYWAKHNGAVGEWEVKPISSNDNFYYGLNLAVDRIAFANKYHVNAAVDFQNSIAKVNPVTGELYNSSKEHKAAISYVYGDAFDDLSQTTTQAIDFMQDGIIEELEAGHYTLGRGSAPALVELGVGTLNTTLQLERLSLIEANWTECFNSAVSSYRDKDGNNPLVDSKGNALITFDLDIDAVATDVAQNSLIYQGVQMGKYDIQYAYIISGNAYDTINNQNILSINYNRSGFILGFSVDTSIPSGDIYWDGKYWSFDALWQACNGGTVLDSKGAETSEIVDVDPAFEGVAEATYDSEGTATFSVPVSVAETSLSWEVSKGNPCKVYNSDVSDYSYNCVGTKDADGKSITFVAKKDAYVDAAYLFESDNYKGFNAVYGTCYYDVSDGNNSATLSFSLVVLFKANA